MKNIVTECPLVDKDSSIKVPDFPIDAVIPWVDGADPQHAEKLNKYLSSLGAKSRPRSANPARFHHSGELDYCVTSLLRFAPWIRTIFIVTDEQTPDLMKIIEGTAYAERIKIIDHKIVFSGFEQYLPTFNSSSILSVLWRVPDLSEHFLFLNDDFALINPVEPQDFFREGKVVLRGRWRTSYDQMIHRKIGSWLSKIGLLGKKNPEQIRAGFQAGQQVSAKLLGFTKKYFRLPHNPHAWRISILRNYFEQHPDILEHNVSYPLRSPKQFIGEALAAHLELRNNTAIIDNRKTNVQLKPTTQSKWRISRMLAKADVDKNIVFTCVQSIEAAPEESQRLIFAWLERRIGNLSDFINGQQGN